MIEKIRAMIDFGALSPYLKQKETGVNLCQLRSALKFIQISNINRTEWSPVRPVIVRTTTQRESDLFITGMTTDPIGRHEVLLSVNHKNDNFREKKEQPGYEKKEKICIKRLTKKAYIT